MSTLSAVRFQKIIYDYYRLHKRDLPWRKTRDPYRILISEVMLQQTQVERVISKYRAFIKAFPGFCSLANAKIGSVLKVWQGLGYNRRAKSLRDIAQIVIRDHGGRLPESVELLETFPGIGTATASAICVFAFNRAIPFIETNIRRTFLHFFFQGQRNVRDSQILPLVSATMDEARPREWYYALMDYGVKLRREYPGILTKSAQYKKQSPFQGSDRQVRGTILKVLISQSSITEAKLAMICGIARGKLIRNLVELQKEGFIIRKGAQISLQ